MTHHTDAERQDFEAWCDKNEYDRVERLDGSGYNNEKTKRAWLAWQAGRRAQVAPSSENATVNVWQQAVDHELVNAHLGVAGDVTAEEAAKALHDLICWNIEVATDPLTNGGKVLVPTDAIATNKPSRENIHDTINKPEPEVVAWRWRKPIVDDQGETVGETAWKLSDAPDFLPWWTNDPLIRLSDYERLQAECEKLRKHIAQTDAKDAAPAQEGWCDGCSPDNCCGCGPAAPAK